MGDFNYWKFGCLEITVETACCANLPSSKLEENWLENQVSLVEFLKLANKGIRGIVKFANGKLGVNLTVTIDSREPSFKTNHLGEYYRILSPGTYRLELLIGCVSIHSRTIEVKDSVSEINIEISNDFYAPYLNNRLSLDRYGLYCTKKGPIECSKSSTQSSRSFWNKEYFVLALISSLNYFFLL
jgi:hypothetical protein